MQDVAAEHGGLIENGNFLAILSQMSKEAQRGALALTGASLAACQGMDLIVAGLGGVFAGVAIGEKLGIPLVQAYYIPFTPTRAYPAFVVPKPPRCLGTLPNRSSYQVARQIMWQPFRGRQAGAAGGVGSAPAPFFGPFDRPPARPADPLRLQPGRHPAARGLGRRRPCDRLLVPRSGRGLDAGRGPGRVPGGRPAPGLRRLREHEQPESRGNRQPDPGRAGADGAARHHPRRLERVAAERTCRTPC